MDLTTMKKAAGKMVNLRPKFLGGSDSGAAFSQRNSSPREGTTNKAIMHAALNAIVALFFVTTSSCTKVDEPYICFISGKLNADFVAVAVNDEPLEPIPEPWIRAITNNRDEGILGKP